MMRLRRALLVPLLAVVVALSLLSAPAVIGQPAPPTLEECLADLPNQLLADCIGVLEGLLTLLQPPTPTPEPAQVTPPPPPPTPAFGDIGPLPFDAVVAQPRFTG